MTLTEEDGWIWLGSIMNEAGEYVGYKDYKDLPGWSEDCEECPEWGWEQKADGVWVWNSPMGQPWFPQEDGSWRYEFAYPDAPTYELLPGWIEECHCEDQGWGWVDVNDDGIEEWLAPDGSL